MSYEGTPGFRLAKEAHGETTIVVERDSLLEAARHLRDARGFNFLADVTSADYLGWGETDIAGYWGNVRGRDLNAPGTAGMARSAEPKEKRFAVSYHLLALRSDPARVRLQVWVDDGEPVHSVVGIWPTADWHEREVYDLMGIPVAGHPNLERILMSEDWEGHPLRKDYPIGGEPVRFSEQD
ncbi:MAG: NADH-quinone oxidoreductase subunit C [Deltaproteobacteria bacterium]|nr:NADH-quinone oxidoreductase subunit C [Deltaproteobacteria bacterium]